MSKDIHNICIISIHFYPMKTSCAVQMSHLASEFANNGNEVTVITPTSNIFDKSSILKPKNYDIFRFRSLKISDISFVRRALNELLLPFCFISAYYFSSIKKKNFDYIIWYSPSIFFSPIIWFLKKRFQSKTYLILRDIFPEWTIDLGILKDGVVYRFLKSIAKIQYKVADKIGIQSKSNFYVIQDYVQKNKVEVLNNWTSNSDAHHHESLNIDAFNNDNSNQKTIIYLGNMGIAQDMYSLLEIAEIFQKREFKGIFLFIGRGTEVQQLKNITKNKKIKNVKFFDEIDPKYVPSLLKDCSAGLISLDPRHKTHNIPGKFISYIESSLPVIARINSNSDLEEIITKNQIGLVYSDNNLNEFAMKISNMLDNDNLLRKQSERARNLFLKEFTTESAYTQIMKFYDEF